MSAMPTSPPRSATAILGRRSRTPIAAMRWATVGLSLLVGCKSSPQADGTSRTPNSGGGREAGVVADAAPSAEESRNIRIDGWIKEWDAVQGTGSNDEAKAPAQKIADEVDRDFAYFAAASKGDRGLKVQNLAVQALAFSRNRAATALLVDRLRDLDGSVVGNALIGLKIRSDPDTPLKPLVGLLRAQYAEARRYAPLALANVVRAKEIAHQPIDPALSDAAMAALVGLVEDHDPYARLHAAKAMGALRRTDAIDFLVLLMSDDRATIRIAAAAALERIGDPRSFPSIVALFDRMTDEQKPYVRDILVSFAGQMLGRPMTAVEIKGLDVSPRAWDRWFSARETTKRPDKSTAPP